MAFIHVCVCVRALAHYYCLCVCTGTDARDVLGRFCAPTLQLSDWLAVSAEAELANRPPLWCVCRVLGRNTDTKECDL